jgi:hypothetical protein
MHHLIEVQRSAPSLLETPLEAVPEVTVLTEHPRSIGLALSKDVGRGLGGLVERRRPRTPTARAKPTRRPCAWTAERARD